MSSTASPVQSTDTTVQPSSVPLSYPASSATPGPHSSLEDGEIRGSPRSADDDDTEPAVSLGSIDVSLGDDQEGDTSWRSWRTRYSSEADLSNNSDESKASPTSNRSTVSRLTGSYASPSMESLGSQDIEVITSPSASLRLYPYDEKSHPYNMGDNAHCRTDSASSTSALPSRYAYPDSYSESNPYVYPTSSPTSATSVTKPNPVIVSASNTSVTVPTSASQPTTDDSNSNNDFSSNAAGEAITTTGTQSMHQPLCNNPSSVPKPSVTLRKRLNASIPIINPVDRSVVRTPAMQSKEGAASLERGLLTVEEEMNETGEHTVVPSPLPTPTDSGVVQRKFGGSTSTESENEGATEDYLNSQNLGQVVYYAKPPIDLSELLAQTHAKHAAASDQDCASSVISSTSAGSLKPSTTASQSAFKSPNVYINGLPPYFPEDELFALASPFGAVRSVRSFTRHVDIATAGASMDASGGLGYGGVGGALAYDDGVVTIGGKKASGYGFVLFETIEAAERCIEGLKKYRNLHPSFSKQVHKIPGTPYSTMQAETPIDSALDSQSTPNGGDVNGDDDPDSFKARMEKLEDKSSTNLYIEGLPLSIDGPLLAALVSPYQIKSSRFFQTKLSHPPRIIAFVRLETRSAAEEIIERLHGRMVRGLNDAGSRISVRFADNSEQRELRRNERQTRQGPGGDSSANQLTIAQAALLNLRGQELRNPPLGLIRSGSLGGLSGSPSLSTLAGPSAVPSAFGRTQKANFAPNSYVGFRNDFSLGRMNTSMTSPTFGMDAANAGLYVPPRFHASRGSYDAEEFDRERVRHHGQSDQLGGPRGSEERLAGKYPVIGSGQRFDSGAGMGLNSRMNVGLGGVGMGLHGMGIGLTNRHAQLQAFSGYTPAEELIFQAHNTSLKNRNFQPQSRSGSAPRPQRLGRVQTGRAPTEESDVGFKSRRSAPLSALRTSHQVAGGNFESLEDEFHSNRGNVPNADSLHSSSTMLNKQQISTVSPVLPYHFSVQQQQSAPGHQAHIRSTTVPHPNRAATTTKHHSHSSISNPHSSTTMTASSNSSASNDARSAHTTTTANKYMDTNNYDKSGTNKNTSPSSLHLSKHNNTNTISHERSNTNSQVHRHHQRTSSDLYKSDIDISNLQDNGTFKRGQRTTADGTDQQESPTLLSPTLTYGSQTPATLSPATPYFGSFSSTQGESLQTQGKPRVHTGHAEVKGVGTERREMGVRAGSR